MTLTEKFEQNIDQVNSDFQAIKSKLIECGVEVADGTKTAELAEKVGEVYNSGRKAENEAFWDAYQQNGERTNYSMAFGGIGWTDESFTPKYNMRVTNNDMMFGHTAIKDLGTALRKTGVTLTLAQTSYGRMYQNGLLEKIGGIIYEFPIRGLSYTFYGCKNLVEIEDTIPLTDTGNCTSDRSFVDCFALEEIRFSGVIGQNGFDFKDCTKLSKTSITSIINALSTTTSGLTVTLSKTAVDNAFEGGSGGGEFHDLIDSKENWIISLI